MLIRRNENSLFPSVPSIIEDFFNDGPFLAPVFKYNSSLPAVNVKETDNEYELEVAVPGMKREDFKVNLENNMLTVSAECKDEHEDKNRNYSRKEFSYSSFSRSFALPDNSVEEDKIEAKYIDGVLKIYLPKAETAKPKPLKQIEIS